MVHIKGTSIFLVDNVKVGIDPFGAPILQKRKIPIDNVLISPTSSEDVINQLNLTGKKSVYTLAIPKGDAHEWEEKEVFFFGKTWRVIGIPLEGLEELIPLEWNKKVMVERYE